MAKKVISKSRKNDMDMRAPASVIKTPDRVEIPYVTEEVSSIAPTQHTSVRRRKGPRILLLLLVLAAISTAGYFYHQWNVLRQGPQSVSQEKTQEMVARVSKLIDLPQNETPSLVTITDTTDLKEQAFFKNVKKGHVVLFYALARKAYLYDPEVNIIVEVASLAAGESISQ